MTSETKILRRRNVVIEEGIPTDDRFSLRVNYYQGDALPIVGQHLQFLRDDGGYRSYVVTHVIDREVHDSDFLYDTYILVSRTALEWQPMSQ